MAELTPERIYELTEQTIPLADWAVEVSISGSVDEKLIISDFLTYEKKVEIGNWNMSTTGYWEVELTDIASVDRVEGIVIIDDDGLQYDGSALYDNYVHGAVVSNGQSAAKTVAITGISEYNEITDITALATSASLTGLPRLIANDTSPTPTNIGGGGVERKLLLSGYILSRVSESSLGQYTYNSLGISSSAVFVQGTNHEDYQVRINHDIVGLNYIVEIDLYVNGEDLDTPLAYDVLNYDLYSIVRVYISSNEDRVVINFHFKIYALSDTEVGHTHNLADTHVHDGGSHYHVLGQHLHTISGSGTTGVIATASGLANKSVQVIHRINRTTGYVQLTHTACNQYNGVMAGFGVFSPNVSAGNVMQKFKSRTGDIKNRGYIIVKRIFKTV